MLGILGSIMLNLVPGLYPIFVVVNDFEGFGDFDVMVTVKFICFLDCR